MSSPTDPTVPLPPLNTQGAKHNAPRQSKVSTHESQPSIDTMSIYSNYLNLNHPAVQLVNRFVAIPNSSRNTPTPEAPYRPTPQRQETTDEPPPPYTAVATPGTVITPPDSVVGPSRPSRPDFNTISTPNRQDQPTQVIRRKPVTLGAPSLRSTFPAQASSSQLEPPRQEIRKVKSAAVISGALTFGEIVPPLPARSTDDLEIRLPTQSGSSSFLPSVQTPGWKAALGEAQFFATGLLARPVESSRHYSVIRHTYALVWYRGPATSVSITILSDEPLPPKRRIYLQQKGFSGSTGMAIKAFVSSCDSWIDATPQNRADPSQISPTTERGIQRDIARFQKKATGRMTKHVPRETCIIRIPANSQDGYFRLVVTDEKKRVLAGCPVFRIASTSADSSVIRGASLKSMPIELGVKVGSTVANIAVAKYTAPITGVVGAVVGSKMQKYGSKVAKAQNIGGRVYDIAGMDNHIKRHQEMWERTHRDRFKVIETGSGVGMDLRLVGDDSGPVEPFPVNFSGIVSQGSGHAGRDLQMPTANLKDVPESIKNRLPGVYIAWARVVPSNPHPDIDDEWHQAVATVAPPGNLPPKVVPRNKVAVHILEDYDGTTFHGSKVNIMLMGYIRPYIIPRTLEEARDWSEEDLLVTVMSLGRPAWNADVALETLRQQEESRDKSVAGRLTELRGKVQEQMDKIPVHFVGVRTEGAGLREAGVENGGIWIAR